MRPPGKQHSTHCAETFEVAILRSHASSGEQALRAQVQLSVLQLL